MPLQEEADMTTTFARRMAIVVIASSLFIGACGGTSDANRTVDLTTASYASAGELAAASDYLVRGRVSSEASPVSLNKDAGLVYMASDVTVEAVKAERPDTSSPIDAGDTIRVGISTLDPTQESSITNFDELSERFPTADDALDNSEEVLIFLVHSDLGDGSLDFEAVGFATINGETITWRGFPGILAGTTSNLAAVESAVVGGFDHARATVNPPNDRTDPQPIRGDQTRPPASKPSE